MGWVVIMGQNAKTIWLDVPDCKIRIITFKNENENAPIMIALQGGPGCRAEAFFEQASFIELNKHFNAVYFDQRGEGESYYNLKNGLTIEQITDDVQAVVKWAKSYYPNKPVFLYGCSYGGKLSMLYLERFQSEIDRVVLDSPAISTLDMNTLALGAISEALKSENISSDIRAILSSIYESKDVLADNPCIDTFLDTLREPPVGLEGVCFGYAMRKWLGTADQRYILKDIKIPLQIMQGSEDFICPLSTLKAAIKEANNPFIKLIEFKGKNHGLFNMDPENMVKYTLEFFN